LYLVHTFCYYEYMNSGRSPHSVVAGLVDELSRLQGSDSDHGFAPVIAEWAGIQFDSAAVVGWTPDEARAGLAELERVRRSMAAVTAVLTNRLAAGRDTQAMMCRATGMSSRDARAAVDVAKVINNIPEAHALLASGAVSAGHLRALAHLKTDLAAELLPFARSMNVDEFVLLVRERNVKHNTNTLAEEQEATRSVTFFETPNGCVGARIVLPPVDGVEFRETLNQLCDAAYRKAHPERADALGSHDVEPRERRLADAFRTWMRTKKIGSGKPVVIVTIEAETLNAHIVPKQPIPLKAALELVARSDLYVAIRKGTDRAKLIFGRNKRLATPLQRLALMSLQETCVWEGCDRPAQICDVDHQDEFGHGGNSNIDKFRFLCGLHHPHRHLTDVDVHERPDGTWTLVPPPPLSERAVERAVERAA
jgi:hypothetical protein